MTTNQANDRTIVFLYGMTSKRIITAADGRTWRRAAERDKLDSESSANRAKMKNPKGFAK